MVSIAAHWALTSLTAIIVSLASVAPMARTNARFWLTSVGWIGSLVSGWRTPRSWPSKCAARSGSATPNTAHNPVGHGGTGSHADLTESQEVVLAGGGAVGTLVGFIASPAVSSGGVAVDVRFLSNYSSATVFTGGSVVSALVHTELLVSSRGAASATTVVAGGNLVVTSGTETGRRSRRVATTSCPQRPRRMSASARPRFHPAGFLPVRQPLTQAGRLRTH